MSTIKKENNGGTTGKGFTKGKSGNPNGRPMMPEELKEKCRSYTEEGINNLIEIAQDKKKQPKDRIKAIEILLERGYGKAAQAIIGGDEGDKPIKLTVEGIVNLLNGGK
jgi:hypothetical protein